jgi:hypothetical protein
MRESGGVDGYPGHRTTEPPELRYPDWGGGGPEPVENQLMT